MTPEPVDLTAIRAWLAEARKRQAALMTLGGDAPLRGVEVLLAVLEHLRELALALPAPTPRDWAYAPLRDEVLRLTGGVDGEA